MIKVLIGPPVLLPFGYSLGVKCFQHTGCPVGLSTNSTWDYNTVMSQIPNPFRPFGKIENIPQNKIFTELIFSIFTTKKINKIKINKRYHGNSRFF